MSPLNDLLRRRWRRIELCGIHIDPNSACSFTQVKSACNSLIYSSANITHHLAVSGQTSLSTSWRCSRHRVAIYISVAISWQSSVWCLKEIVGIYILGLMSKWRGETTARLPQWRRRIEKHKNKYKVLNNNPVTVTGWRTTLIYLSIHRSALSNVSLVPPCNYTWLQSHYAAYLLYKYLTTVYSWECSSKATWSCR